MSYFEHVKGYFIVKTRYKYNTGLNIDFQCRVITYEELGSKISVLKSC